MAKQAFEGSRRNVFMMDPDAIVVVTDKKDPLFDERASLKPGDHMVFSIMARGVLEPVLVCKRGDDAVVIDGRQRVLAAREANKRLAKEGEPPVLVPVFQRKGDDDLSLLSVMITANEIRTPDATLVKAKKAKRLLDRGASEKDIAVSFGVTQACVKNWLELLEASPEVQKAVAAGELSATDARRLSKQPREKQEKRAAAAKGSDRKPRMRTRKEVEALLAEAELSKEEQQMLKWVLREVEFDVA